MRKKISLGHSFLFPLQIITKIRFVSQGTLTNVSMMVTSEAIPTPGDSLLHNDEE